ncbi:flagellar hook-basal body complex protein FliE [Streptomyces sp. AC495_CC817]|uniref:flagellar hook-basal body complex protein FliE n=1 Tax=Streptomyces sp. AC495_CC817 TaxID=2823900 RepID=UPI001C272F63|nr:flagellar hook-basal body complex protein FliE [Streptomyces sp. AC495_CC817]
MSDAIEAISAAGVSGLSPLSFETGREGSPAPTGAGGFATSLTGAVENLQQLQSTSNELAVQAVTGDLQDIHQAMIASARASVTLDLVVAVRDRSVSAFTEIMRMQA